MRALALAITVVAGFLVVSRWGTPEALAWTVAFCGWLPHALEENKESINGNQA